LVLEISISACEKSRMGRKPLDWYPLAAVCVCVCVCVSVSVSEVWHLSEMLNAGFDHVLNENWFPLIVVESSFLDSKRYNLKEHLLHLISHIMIKTCADDEIQIYIIYIIFL